VKKGFVMLVVMMILFMMGTEFLILNSTSGFIAIETSDTFLKADRQNLVESGLALARLNESKKGEIFEPDTGGLAFEGAKLSIKIENGKQAVISTFCRRGGRELKKSGKYDIFPKTSE